MAKIKTKDGDVFMVRGYFQTRRNPDQLVEFETDCPVAISHLTPCEALRLAEDLTKAAYKAYGLATPARHKAQKPQRCARCGNTEENRRKRHDRPIT